MHFRNSVRTVAGCMLLRGHGRGISWWWKSGSSLDETDRGRTDLFNDPKHEQDNLSFSLTFDGLRMTVQRESLLLVVVVVVVVCVCVVFISNCMFL